MSSEKRLSHDPSISQIIGSPDLDVVLKNHQIQRSPKKMGSMQMQLVPVDPGRHVRRGVSGRPTLNSDNRKYLQFAAGKMGAFR